MRAQTVGMLIHELNILKLNKYPPSCYEALRGEYPGFLCFEIAGEIPDLQKKLFEDLYNRPRHVWLAQELAVARHGVALSTIQKDWKMHKPSEFRRRRSANGTGKG